VLRGRDVDEVLELKRQGLSIRAISRLTATTARRSADIFPHRGLDRSMVREFRL
jgi:hypothetical protein